MEDLCISDTRHQCACRQWPDPRDCLQALANRILAVPGVDLPLQLLNLAIEYSEMVQQSSEQRAACTRAYPNNVSLGSYTQKPDKRKDVELAPTAWSDVSQNDLSDKSLRWYHFDEGRHDSMIADNELPGFSVN
jgi:hypothetical protein